MNSSNVKYRIEKDSIGEINVPAEHYYGVQTERARQNFDISDRPCSLYPRLIWSLGIIKKSAALANYECGALDKNIAEAIVEASNEVIDGKLQKEFPIDVIQGGGGTSLNMNINEVIANRANEILTGNKGYDRVHPNTHVNMGQSTNDVIPASMKMASFYYIKELTNTIEPLRESLSIKAQEFDKVVKVARTCLQDALPITLGQEFSGYLSFILRQRDKLEHISKSCLELPLGGTAVGTSLSVHPGYLEKVYEKIAEVTGKPFVKEENLFDGLQNADSYIDISAVLKSLASGLSKMARDFRLMSSGPRSGLNEINIPSVQPGSSIMPGKINPVMPEMINQMAYIVCGNDMAITMAVEAGELDLNVWEPVIIKSLFESFQLLTRAIPLFVEKCISGINANVDVCKHYAESSIALSTVIATRNGYEAGSKVAHHAVEKGQTIKDACLELNVLSKEKADELLDPILLTDPNCCNILVKD